MISRKIVVGTANFGTEYGHFSQKKVDKNNIRKILSTSRKNNIYTLDTAQDYKSSEKLLGIFSVFKPDIVQAPYNIFDRRIEVSGWLKNYM